MASKILVFDIETDGVNARYANLGFVCCFGYKWLGDDTTHCLNLADFPKAYEDDPHNDRLLLKAANKIMTSADGLVAHYGAKFDRKFLQGRFAIQGIPGVPNLKLYDTCLQARKMFKFNSNSLANLAIMLGCPNKMEKGEGWPGWWHKVMRGGEIGAKALHEMSEYCKQDVVALEAIYKRIVPYGDTATMINENLYCGHDDPCCPNCGSVYLQRRGYEVTKTRRYRRVQCITCGKWSRLSGSVAHTTVS